MKKLIQFTITGFAVITLFFSTTGFVQAKNTNNDSPNNLGKVSSEIKSEKSKCAKLSKKQKSACLKKVAKNSKSKKAAESKGSTQVVQNRVNPIPDYFFSYIDKVIPNLRSVYEAQNTFAREIEEKIENLTNQGVDTSTSAQLLTEAKIDIKEAQNSINNTLESYRRETTEAGPTTSLIVINENGNALVTSKESYDNCIQNGGVLMIENSRRCVLGNTVHINPTPAEEVALLMYGIRTHGTPFTITFENIDRARENLKRAQTKLVQANNSLEIIPKTTTVTQVAETSVETD